MRKALVILTLVGLTVLASASDAYAQWGRVGSYYGGRGYSPYYGGYGYGYGPYYQNYGYGPYYQNYGYGYAPGSYYYSEPPTRVVQSFYPGAEQPQQYTAVTVVVPTADAKVWFGETAMTQPGTVRLFHSPPLEPGKNFTYTIKASWMENSQAVNRERQVTFQSGQKITVDFRDTPKEIAPAPDPLLPK